MILYVIITRLESKILKPTTLPTTIIKVFQRKIKLIYQRKTKLKAGKLKA